MEPGERAPWWGSVVDDKAAGGGDAQHLSIGLNRKQPVKTEGTDVFSREVLEDRWSETSFSEYYS